MYPNPNTPLGKTLRTPRRAALNNATPSTTLSSPSISLFKTPEKQQVQVGSISFTTPTQTPLPTPNSSSSTSTSVLYGRTIHQNKRHVIESISPFAQIISSALEDFRPFYHFPTSSFHTNSSTAYLVTPWDASIYFWQYLPGREKSVDKLTFPVDGEDLSGENQISAKQVCIIQGGQKIGAIACNKNGHLRYWPSVSNSSIHLDATMTLSPKEEIVCMKSIQGVFSDEILGCAVIGTSLGTPHLVTISTSSQIQIRQLNASNSNKGWLGSWFSRNTGLNKASPVISFVFGQNTVEGKELYVLTQETLQKWILNVSNPNLDKLVFEFDLKARAELKISSVFTENEKVKVNLIDFALDTKENNLYAICEWSLDELEGRVPIERSPSSAIGIIQILNFSSPSVGEVTELDHDEIKNLHFLELNRGRIIITDDSLNTILFWPNLVVYTIVPKDSRPSDVFVSKPGERIFGGELNSIPQANVLLTSEKFGVLTTRILDIDQNVKPQENLDSSNYPQISPSASPMEQFLYLTKMIVSSNNVNSVKTIFADKILEPITRLSQPQIDTFVTDVSNAILDLRPGNLEDGWGEAATLKSQIELKKRRHKALILILSENRIPLSPSVQHLIALENQGKIEAALALRAFRESLPVDKGDFKGKEFIDQIITRTAEITRKTSLPPQEEYFSNISTIDSILPQVFRSILDIKRRGTISLQDYISVLHQAASIFYTVTSRLDASSFLKQPNYPVTTDFKNLLFLTENFLRSCSENIREDIGEFNDLEYELYEQLAELTDVLLKIYGNAASHKGREFIAIFLNKRPDLAAKLAEKYKDFPTLVIICEKAQDSTTLLSYMNRFFEYNFHDVVFKHYVQTNKWAELLSFPEMFSQPLAQFLKVYPSLSWIHQIRTGGFGEAGLILVKEGENEAQSLSRKRVMLSLGKLARLTTPQNNSTEIAKLNQHYYLTKVQKKLKKDQGFENSSIIPQSHDKVILELLDDPNVTIAKYVYALDLLENSHLIVPPVNYETMLVGVWAHAFESFEGWTQLAIDYRSGVCDESFVIRTLKGTIFYQLVETSHSIQPQVLMRVLERFYSQNSNDPMLSVLLNLVKEQILVLNQKRDSEYGTNNWIVEK